MASLLIHSTQPISISQSQKTRNFSKDSKGNGYSWSDQSTLRSASQQYAPQTSSSDALKIKSSIRIANVFRGNVDVDEPLILEQVQQMQKEKRKEGAFSEEGHRSGKRKR